MHYAIHQFRWTPSELEEWMDCGREMQSFYIGSIELKVENEREERDRIKRGAR